VLPFIIAAGAAYRLARFNLDPNNNSGHFKGLPVPSNAMIWMGVVGFSYSSYVEIPTIATVALVFITTFLMVSTTPLLSLKFKGLGWKGQEIIWILLLSSLTILVISLIVFKSFYLGIIGVMAMYLILSLSYYKKISS
jgi:CDP-diacylglycerol--serine O-phosphatidyltransferase